MQSVLTLRALKYVYIKHEEHGEQIQFEIIIHVLFSSLRFI